MLFIHSSGLLAQLVEQLTFNQLVPRSSRGQPTIFREPSHFMTGLFFDCLFMSVDSYSQGVLESLQGDRPQILH